MTTYYKYFFIIPCFFILSFPASAKQESFDIKNLIHKIPFSNIIENDEITPDQLNGLLNKNLTKKNAVWSLDKQNKNTIIFHSENEKWVLRTYPLKNNHYLLLVNTQLGNHGQTQNFVFFTFDSRSNSLSKKAGRNVYIPDIKENEFLPTKQKFADPENNNALLYMNDNGTISASPKTWMNPQWENKELAYTIKLKWKNNNFVKIKKKI